MNPWITAFVDETGTNELVGPDSPTSHLFICVAVLVDEAGLATADAALRQVSNALCGGAEISSKRIGRELCR